MTKIAVIINGCIRDDLDLYVNLINNTNNYFKNYDIDIYIHTWNSFNNTNISMGEYKYDQCKYNSKMMVLDNVKTIIYDDQYSWEELDTMNIPFTLSEPRGSTSCAVRTSIFNCFYAYKRLLETIKNSNIQYDYILRTRNDLFINIDTFHTIIKEADNNKLCTPPNLWCPNYINDHWIFAKYDILMEILTYKTIDELIDKMSKSWNQEELTFNFLTKNNNEFYILNNFTKYILRSNRIFR